LTLNDIGCFPSPCTRLSLARTTTEALLPYGLPHLGNPRLDI